MYPDESIKDSAADKRRKIYAKLFWVFLALTLVLASTSLYLSFNGNDQYQQISSSETLATASPSATPSLDSSSDEDVAYCNSLVETMPGDLEIVLSWGWEIECVAEGKDPMLGENGALEDLYTAGYADPSTKTIAIDAPSVNASIIVHEAAHALDFEQLVQADRNAMATKYGVADWDYVSDYFKRPSEMFAEARMRCLGYEHDPEYGVMSCEDVDALISGTEESDKINEMAISAP
jgi:hypothetical protein